MSITLSVIDKLLNSISAIRIFKDFGSLFIDRGFGNVDILAFVCFNERGLADSQALVLGIVTVGATDGVDDFRQHSRPILVVKVFCSNFSHHSRNVRAFAGPAA